MRTHNTRHSDLHARARCSPAAARRSSPTTTANPTRKTPPPTCSSTPPSSASRPRSPPPTGSTCAPAPCTSHAIILTMPHGATVNVVGGSGGWYKVTYSRPHRLVRRHLSHARGRRRRLAKAAQSAADKAIARAQTGVGFSYHWGGGCWNPGSSAHGACYGSCPSCSHSGTWGADCSGYVAKVWQVPGASALTTCSHPYSTYNFYNQTTHWSNISRSSVKRGDAYVHNSGRLGPHLPLRLGRSLGLGEGVRGQGLQLRHPARHAHGLLVLQADPALRVLA